MKLTILGSGTLVPNGTRNSAGYFVELPDAQVMMDCGAATVHALDLFGLPWERMTHLLVSHFHVDHVGELASLFFAFRYGMRSERDEPLTLLGPIGLEKVMEGLKSAFGPKLFEPKFPVILQLVKPGDQFDLGHESSLWVAKTPHTDESIAIRIENRGRVLCYTGDTAYSDDLVGFFSGADVLISECSFREPRPDVRHLSIAEVARLASRAAVAKLIVTHFYFEVNEAELRAELERGYGGEVVVGRDGLSIEI